ncbi:hypothetical protein A5672_03460 [Mycobacterium alsense]|uniref:Aminoglycoside phosphotransferase domain-containing protein n=1 Tax=Mycobacterium alsense TaxID=324058 RepID=A0ABD6NW40_9MYCO|nr:aminoglycoside phosphotransferase family protein [Mycobacterium alsense]OBG29099.1 hypothetical protein A5672_03460 [Mycobacterium alsense]
MKSAQRSADWLTAVSDTPPEFIDVAQSMPTAELVGDTAVVLPSPEHGPPEAVLKVGRGPLKAATLRIQRRVLDELSIHQGLDDQWREIVPRILAFDERADTTVSVETYRPGIALADVLARRPNRLEELTAAALRAIAPLHRGTATSVVVDNVCLLRRWVVEPLAGLMDMCRRLDPDLVSEVDRLGTMLRQALVGWRLPVSWTHGDYTPAKVRVAGVRGPVTGIVDWGGARPGQPAFIDEYLMILSASCLVEQTDISALVADRLLAGGLSDRERSALRAAHDRSYAGTGHRQRERIDERVAILLTWLHHAAGVWRACATEPDQHKGCAASAARVLNAVAAWQGCDVSRAVQTGRGTASVPTMTGPSRVAVAAQAQGNQADG